MVISPIKTKIQGNITQRYVNFPKPLVEAMDWQSGDEVFVSSLFPIKGQNAIVFIKKSKLNPRDFMIRWFEHRHVNDPQAALNALIGILKPLDLIGYTQLQRIQWVKKLYKSTTKKGLNRKLRGINLKAEMYEPEEERDIVSVGIKAYSETTAILSRLIIESKKKGDVSEGTRLRNLKRDLDRYFEEVKKYALPANVKRLVPTSRSREVEDVLDNEADHKEKKRSGNYIKQHSKSLLKKLEKRMINIQKGKKQLTPSLAFKILKKKWNHDEKLTKKNIAELKNEMGRKNGRSKNN